MNNKLIKWDIRRVTFADCGLNIENNILQAPICECGCGNYMNVCIQDKQDAADFCYTMLDEDDEYGDVIGCDHCAIFVLFKDNTVMMACRTEDAGIQVVELVDETNKLAIDIVREMQELLQFHCYGLLEEVRDGSFRIVME